jgi:predicted outer membrane repeat protein
MKMLVPFFIVLLFGSICIRLTEGTKIIHVKPVKNLFSCPGNSSCPPDQLCYTMDYLANHSSKFFSSDHVNITLIFMCGVHNYTKHLTLQNLHSFVMKGDAESRENVIIDHQLSMQVDKPSCTIIQFFNVSFVNITTLTMRCPAIDLKESHIIIVNSSNIYGYSGIKKGLSFINVAGRGSQILLDNCTFKENCLVKSNFSDGIIVRNSAFQSYRQHEIIAALSSPVILTGNVNFTDSIDSDSEPLVSLRTIDQQFKSSLIITTGATVYFVNLTCGGGAVYGWSALIHIGAKARVVFMNNIAGVNGGMLDMEGNGTIYIGIRAKVVFMYNTGLSKGAAGVYMVNGKITVGANSTVIFEYNSVHQYNGGGGAIIIENGTLNIDKDAYVRFSHNSVGTAGIGGAVLLHNGELFVNNNASLTFSNNSALRGGAVYLVSNSTIHVDAGYVHFYNNKGSRGGGVYLRYGTVYINANGYAQFNSNTAQVQGGAIYLEFGSIIVNTSSRLLLSNNSAFQGGALYVVPSSFAITVRHQSHVQFTNNTAIDVGGAVTEYMLRCSQQHHVCSWLLTLLLKYRL